MSKIEHETLSDTRGREYTFEVYPRRAAFYGVFQNVAAVYAFIRRGANQHRPGRKVLYVGETEFLEQRLRQHEKWYEAIERGENITHICVRLVKGGESVRRSIEKRLIYNYKPPLNYHHKRL